jgi:hypothetical protein
MYRLAYVCFILGLSSPTIAAGPSPGVPNADAHWAPRPCQPGQVQVMVLGTYHMNNPGLDAMKVQTDDVLTPDRQSQVADLVTRLAAFKPDKVMIESAYGDDTYPKRYTDYLAGKHELTRNEIEQIGFRLAKQLGHKTIYPVDYPMFEDGGAADFYFANHPDAQKQVDADNAKLQEEGKKEATLQHQSSVKDYLVYLNSPNAWGFDLDTRMTMQEEMRMVQNDQYAGADILTSWFKRNTRIMANVLRSLEPSDKHVLIMFGAGHTRYLWDLVDAAPQLCRIAPAQYLAETPAARQ